MSVGILGNKIGMTQIFEKDGNVVPVTIIKSGPCYITQIKSIETDGYNAIQVGYKQIQKNKKRLTKPMLGHFEKHNLSAFQFLREYKISNPEEFEIGQKLSLENFEIGQTINISGLTIGKGNASNIKRNNFGRGPMSHGSKHHRLQGSLGAGSTPGRVFPGKKMPGRLGLQKQTIKNLKIMGIDLNENLLIIKGSIPGKPGNLISIKTQ